MNSEKWYVPPYTPNSIGVNRIFPIGGQNLFVMQPPHEFKKYFRENLEMEDVFNEFRASDYAKPVLGSKVNSIPDCVRCRPDYLLVPDRPKVGSSWLPREVAVFRPEDVIDIYIQNPATLDVLIPRVLSARSMHSSFVIHRYVCPVCNVVYQCNVAVYGINGARFENTLLDPLTLSILSNRQPELMRSLSTVVDKDGAQEIMNAHSMHTLFNAFSSNNSKDNKYFSEWQELSQFSNVQKVDIISELSSAELLKTISPEIRAEIVSAISQLDSTSFENVKHLLNNRIFNPSMYNKLMSQDIDNNLLRELIG